MQKNNCMIKIKVFVFNAFQVNTFLLYDETGKCVIIDPGCSDDREKTLLSDFIEENSLKIVRLLNTHVHIDHIAGNSFIEKKYQLRPEIHKDSYSFLETTKGYVMSFGFEEEGEINPASFIEDGDIISFGNSSLKVLYTPGHVDGSVCFYSSENSFLIAGDVLFKEGIGRTDFPTGDFSTLMTSIKTKLFCLPDETLVFPGHGQTTTIGHEKIHNPFVR